MPVAGGVAGAVRLEVQPFLAACPALCAMAEALAEEIDAHAGLSVAGAAKQLAATLVEIKASVKGGSKSDSVVGAWTRPTLVPAPVRNKA